MAGGGRRSEVRDQKSEVGGQSLPAVSLAGSEVGKGLKDERPTSNIERPTSNEKQKKWSLRSSKIPSNKRGGRGAACRDGRKHGGTECAALVGSQD